MAGLSASANTQQAQTPMNGRAAHAASRLCGALRQHHLQRPFQLRRVPSPEDAGRLRSKFVRETQRVPLCPVSTPAPRQAVWRGRRYKEAVNECTSALEVAPDNQKALLRRAKALEAMGLYKQALSDVQKANRADDSAPENQARPLANCMHGRLAL